MAAYATLSGQVVGITERKTQRSGTAYHELALLQQRERQVPEVVRVRAWSMNGDAPKMGASVRLDDVRVSVYVGKNGQGVVTFDKFYEQKS